MIKFGILVVLHSNPGHHNIFSDEAGKSKKRGPTYFPSLNTRRTLLEGLNGGQISNEVPIAIDVAGALHKTRPNPDLPGAADWRWGEHESISIPSVLDDLHTRDTFPSTP